MTDGPWSFVGCKPIDLLVDESAERASPDRPIVLLLGPEGSGRTTLLRYLLHRARASTGLAHALVDCGGDAHSTAWDLLCEVVDGLDRKWPGARRGFTRTRVARLAVAVTDLATTADPETALLAVLRRADRLHEATATIPALVEALGETLSAPVAVRAAAQQGASLLTRSKVPSKAALRHFADGAGDHRVGLRALVRLNRTHRGDLDGPDRAVPVLLRAFLADVHDLVTRLGGGHNCLLLLDDADGPAATGLLDLIAASRVRAPDDLVVVAVTRGLADLPDVEERWRTPWSADARGRAAVPGTAQASLALWRAHRGPVERTGAWWLPVWLRDLSREELGVVFGERRAGYLHRLTHGHPRAAAFLADALPEDPRAARNGQSDLPDLRDRLDDAAEWYLTGDDGPLALGAARDAPAAAALCRALRLRDHHDRFEQGHWLSDVDGRGALEPHPWLRRVLLHALGRTGRWREFFEALRVRAAADGSEVDLAYYLLALGEVEQVAWLLAARLDTAPPPGPTWDDRATWDTGSWIDRLDEITVAPLPGGPAVPAADRFDVVMAARSERLRADPVAREVFALVAARWIWADPLADPGLDLTDAVADAYAAIAGQVRGGLVRFRQESKLYRNLDPLKQGAPPRRRPVRPTS
ncbi:CobW-like GTP-binding protein [Actinokineospora sp. PR83]|uniref:CobW-like GTP-binding protein n=1 Tax=Actinokineospora sp. PR83 TaxID=2884908 RepID=UPI001F3ACC76|nr:CobW-like GTP-binding protein [Actinokineospora sp. PR83]MCG8919932.1 CobW-like GTP-binding protein [Actinokineospora sp. PR83]